MKDYLYNLGICCKNSTVPFYPKTRDRDNVSVLKCQKSGVIFLSRSDHAEISYYKEKNFSSHWGEKERKKIIFSDQEDSNRRFNQFKKIITNKKWLDVGSGPGGIVDLFLPIASRTTAVEPQKTARELLAKECGCETFPLVDDVPYNDIDVVTLFHVFEHLTDPLETLLQIRKKMKKNGKIIIEVPHAKDFLISFLNLEAFKAFTFWSEHLILHTRNSLSILIELAGFKDIVILGCQRHPLVNHFYWLAKGRPSGHLAWDHLRTNNLDQAYEDMLAKIDSTDTLVAIASK